MAPGHNTQDPDVQVEKSDELDYWVLHVRLLRTSDHSCHGLLFYSGMSHQKGFILAL